MPTLEEVKAYISRLPNSDTFTSLDAKKQEAYIFNATETLKHYIKSENPRLNERAVALQALYQYDGDSEEYGRLKAHGVSSFSAKDVSVSFEQGATTINPESLMLINDLNPGTSGGRNIGRLI